MALSVKNNRRSWFPWVKIHHTMNNDEATFWLSQFIGKNLRIHASDGRVFGGQMKCTDKVSQTATFCFISKSRTYFQASMSFYEQSYSGCKASNGKVEIRLS